MSRLVENSVRKVRRKPFLPKRVDQMSKEVLHATLLKKRECNRRAQHIVERLLEETVPQDWFLDSLQFISDGHFQDVVEERALAKLCGYPLCTVQLPLAPPQQYRISTKLNKVYDITDRKNFCSNSCYAAAKFLKQQLLTSPLWLRDKEEVPVFTILPTVAKSEGVGDELDFGMEKVVAEQNELSSSQTAAAEHTDAEGFQHKARTTATEDGSVSELVARLIIRELACGGQSQDSGIVSSAPNGSTVRESDRSFVEPVSASCKQRVMSEHHGSKSTVNLEIHDSKCMGVDFKAANSKCPEDVEIPGNNSLVNLQCANSKDTSTCKLKVGLEAAADRLCEGDKTVVGRKKGRSKNNSEEPVVRSVVLYVEKCLKEWVTVDTIQLLLGEESRDSQDDTGVPLVDHHAQAALRRRIVLDRLYRVVPDMMAALGVVSCDISSDVRELVATFCLGAHNITFHVPEWNILALILISVVSLKNKQLQQQLRSKKVKNSQTMILLSFQQDSGYLDRVVCWLTDLDQETN